MPARAHRPRQDRLSLFILALSLCTGTVAGLAGVAALTAEPATKQAQTFVVPAKLADAAGRL
jgi:hypothetical protein